MGMNKDMSENAILSTGEKLAYGLGDFGGGIFYYVTLAICTYFYTNVMGISAITIGSIMVLSRCFDGVSDFAMGVIIDKTRTKIGRARPWVLIMTIPYGLSMVLMYLVPENATMIQQYIYVFITYNFAVTLCYTGMSIPYGVLPTMMTRNVTERALCTVFRMTLSALGGAVALATAFPLINALGGDHRAWVIAMTIYATACIILNLITCFNCVERVRIDSEAGQSKVKFSRGLWSALSNPYWWIMVVLFILFNIYLTGNATMMTYYAQYILGDTSFMTIMSFAEKGMTALGAIVGGILVRKDYKSDIIKYGMLLTIPAQLIMAFGSISVMTIFVSAIIRGFSWGILYGLINSLPQDVIEYGHWRSGVRAEGMTYTSTCIGNKLGVTLGGGVLMMILGAFGFDGTLAVQPASAEGAITFFFVWLPLIVSVIIFVLLMFYKIDRQSASIIQDLNEGKFGPKAHVSAN